MAMFTAIRLYGTCDSNGALVVKADRSVNGLLYGIHQDNGTLAAGVDFTVAVVQSEMLKTIITLTDANTDNTAYYPRSSSCGATGTSNSDNLIMMAVVGTLQLTIAQGGNAGKGGLYVFIIE
jgi:hypothetical protein